MRSSVHKWLRDHGIIPVDYEEGNPADRIKEAAGQKIDAFIDTHGGGFVELAIKLGVPTDRINTIIDLEAAKKYKVKTAGNSDAASADVLAELAELIATGRLEIPIAKYIIWRMFVMHSRSWKSAIPEARWC